MIGLARSIPSRGNSLLLIEWFIIIDGYQIQGKIFESLGVNMSSNVAPDEGG